MLRICALFVLCLVASLAHAGPQGVVRVVDADTWDVGGTRVRLHAIDAPELDQTCRTDAGRDWACGRWATEMTRARFQGRSARCTDLGTDRYARVVARCSVDGADAGAEMVRAGLAFAYRKYGEDYVRQERAARSELAGLWSSRIARPEDHRAARAGTGTPPVAGCTIKGNVSSRGERIYHRPGQQHYDRTSINPDKGERWFCTEADARAAGWRAARS